MQRGNNKQRGVDFIEVLLFLALFGFLAVAVLESIYGVETQCIAGYTFTKPIRTARYIMSPRQVIDENGHGIPCK